LAGGKVIHWWPGVEKNDPVPRAHGVRRAIKQSAMYGDARARLPGCLHLFE
jgi:hypothetical protein